MSGVASLYGGLDMTKVMFGQNATEGRGWLYVISGADKGYVKFVGSARLPEPGRHPFQFGSDRNIIFAVGGMILRPDLVIGTDSRHYVGAGASALMTRNHSIPDMLDDGEVIVGPDAPTLIEAAGRAERAQEYLQ